MLTAPARMRYCGQLPLSTPGRLPPFDTDRAFLGARCEAGPSTEGLLLALLIPIRRWAVEDRSQVGNLVGDLYRLRPFRSLWGSLNLETLALRFGQ